MNQNLWKNGAIMGKVPNSQNCPQSTEKFPFDNFFKLLSFYRLQNPARAKYINVLENDIKSKVNKDAFSEEHTHRIYASVAYVIARALSFYTEPEKKAWQRWYIERPDRMSFDELANDYGFSKRTLQRRFVGMRESIEAFARARKLLPPVEQ